MASAHTAGARLQTQYLTTGVSTRRSSVASSSSCASKARARRMVSMTAASHSSARSASTLRISGCSLSSRPNARRPREWWIACETHCRIRPAEPMALSSRV